ncbi:MAG: hypothetical protein SFT93_05525 [Rickettsiaceae bacterium]|nr:hypothetical protein [Rickettsiaceae bacterium]
MNKIKCTINFPTNSENIEEADLIILPGSTGEIGVMYGHMDLVVELSDGDIRFYKNGAIKQILQTKGGVAQIARDTIEIYPL